MTYKAVFDTKRIVWLVKNIKTNAIQSAWGNNKAAALIVARDLNRKVSYVRS